MATDDEDSSLAGKPASPADELEDDETASELDELASLDDDTDSELAELSDDELKLDEDSEDDASLDEEAVSDEDELELELVSLADEPAPPADELL